MLGGVQRIPYGYAMGYFSIHGLLQPPVRVQKGNKRFILGLDRGPSDGGGCKVPGLRSHAMPLGGNTHHLLARGVCPPSGSSWRRRAGTFCSPQVRQRGLQSTRRTTTSMPAPAAGAANGLAVLSRASRPQPGTAGC